MEAAASAPAGVLTMIEALLGRLTYAMAWLSGASFLLLSFYMTADVIGRYMGTYYTGVTDDISVYVLAVGGTWAMAEALRAGAHVSVDVIVHFLPARLRAVLATLSLAATTVFSAILAYYAWILAIDSHELGTRSITMLQAPLEIPQGLMAFGLSVLTLQALLTTLVHALGRRRARLEE
ncbi:TRAP transporter small permease [Chelatococcus sp. GCM10030263]|uniref:TRAP transporter small permease n=1 Tax=Chelatococcus sp. GCM10030263 TaxID=3273387 RepID=UPI00360EECD5